MRVGQKVWIEQMCGLTSYIVPATIESVNSKCVKTTKGAIYMDQIHSPVTERGKISLWLSEQAFKDDLELREAKTNLYKSFAALNRLMSVSLEQRQVIEELVGQQSDLYMRSNISASSDSIDLDAIAVKGVYDASNGLITSHSRIRVSPDIRLVAGNKPVNMFTCGTRL